MSVKPRSYFYLYLPQLIMAVAALLFLAAFPVYASSTSSGTSTSTTSSGTSKKNTASTTTDQSSMEAMQAALKKGKERAQSLKKQFDIPIPNPCNHMFERDWCKGPSTRAGTCVHKKCKQFFAVPKAKEMRSKNQ
jgi:hypothetical protein